MFGNMWRYVSIYGGLLSLFVKFSRSIKIKVIKLHIFGKKNRKIWKIENCAKKMSKLWKNSSPIKNDSLFLP